MPVICFAMENEIKKLFDCGYDILGDISRIKDYLLECNSLLVELLDLGYDGNSLFLYAKKGSDKILELKSFLKKYMKTK